MTTYYKEANVNCWNCDKGDTVVFVLNPKTKFVPGKFWYGTVVRRIGKKHVLVRCGQLGKTFTLHVFCVRVTKQAYENTPAGKNMRLRIKREAEARKRWLARMEALSKPQSVRKKAKKKAIKVNEVAGMVFKY